MNNDAASFILLCLMTRLSFKIGLPIALTLAVGLSLIIIGMTIKIWAAKIIGLYGYHWGDFFIPSQRIFYRKGPYLICKNPMYGFGYLHAYGFALLMFSWPGLVFAAFDQASIYALYFFIERKQIADLAFVSTHAHSVVEEKAA